MPCQLICVPPKVVGQVWPRVRGLIHLAIKKGDFSSFAPVQDRVLQGQSLLWVAWDGESPDVEAAAVTEIQRTEWRKFCVIVACAGAHMDRWIHLLDTIEDYARGEECTAVRLLGRNGWEKMLPAYRRKRIVLEKIIGNGRCPHIGKT